MFKKKLFGLIQAISFDEQIHYNPHITYISLYASLGLACLQTFPFYWKQTYWNNRFLKKYGSCCQVWKNWANGLLVKWQQRLPRSPDSLISFQARLARRCTSAPGVDSKWWWTTERLFWRPSKPGPTLARSPSSTWGRLVSYINSSLLLFRNLYPAFYGSVYIGCTKVNLRKLELFVCKEVPRFKVDIWSKENGIWAYYPMVHSLMLLWQDFDVSKTAFRRHGRRK